MKALTHISLALAAALATPMPAQTTSAAASFPRPLRELNTDYFPLHHEGPITPEIWARRSHEIRERILLASGLFPLPTRTPLNAVVHGRVERDDYTIDRVFFESFPGHYVTGSLYLPKNPPKDGKMPGILSPHGHWAKGRFLDNGAGTETTKQLLAIGAERFESGARSHLQARCAQLARMGCAVFIYDTLGEADSIQIMEHRSGKRPDLLGKEPGTFGLYSPAADLRLQSNFGLQTWNSIRALDFLLTVPGVDPTRLSCTGASGGATQAMMLAAIDDRLATTFPAVMVGTAMQGGCTCENGSYLRINQGNIDIAAAFAPKPMGLTAADDWTRELETKGFPELKAVWNSLGQPENLIATFNIHWKHNYNHVSRTTMYDFMNRHFQLGFSEPVLERDFVVSTREDATVWTAAHPKPTGDRVGGEHEKALLKYWSEDSDRLLAGRKDLLGRAWSMIIGRSMPDPADVSFTGTPDGRGGHVLLKGIVHDRKHNEKVPCAILQPGPGAWNGMIALWLANGGLDTLGGESGPLTAAARRLLDAGFAIACPSLYMADAGEQPMNPVRSQDESRAEWRWAACYTYGYNPPLVARRVHDAMNVVSMLRANPEFKSAKIIIVGTDGAGAVAAAAAATMPLQFSGAAIDTEGFRFSSLNDQWHPMFVPGAVKYGDIPGLLSLAEALRPVVLGESGIKGGADAIAAAVSSMTKSSGDERRITN
jgi:dienelactone hydrolase